MSDARADAFDRLRSDQWGAHADHTGSLAAWTPCASGSRRASCVVERLLLLAEGTADAAPSEASI